MTIAELNSLLVTNLTRVGSNRISGPDVLQSCQAIVSYFSTQLTDIIPDWTSSLIFQTDGTDAGKYCKHPDSNGKKRIFETKTDDNTNNTPPTDPNVSENTHWKEVSASSSSAIQEWTPGLYGPGLIIVYHNHSTDGRGLYLLTEAVRPYNSTNIETEIIAGKWAKIGSSELGYTAENVANKATDFSIINDTLYPNIQAVENRILSALAGLKWKAPVLVATTGNITLSGEQVIDGVTTNTSRVLVKDHATPALKGIYVSGSGAWTRATDADSAAELEGATVTVLQGSTNADTTWIQVADNINLGSSNLVWSQFGASVPDATESVKGISKIVQQSVIENESTTNDTDIVTARKFWYGIIRFISLAWTWAAKQTFTSAPRFSSTTGNQHLRVDNNKDLTSTASASGLDLVAGTDDVKPVTSTSFKAFRDLSRQTVSISSGTLTLNANSKQEQKYEVPTPVSSNFIIAFSGDTNAEVISVTIPITGTVAITLPSTVVMEKDDYRFVNSTKILTVVGGTAEPFELSFNKMTGLYMCRASYAYYSS